MFLGNFGVLEGDVVCCVHMGWKCIVDIGEFVNFVVAYDSKVFPDFMNGKCVVFVGRCV